MHIPRYPYFHLFIYPSTTICIPRLRSIVLSPITPFTNPVQGLTISTHGQTMTQSCFSDDRSMPHATAIIIPSCREPVLLDQRLNVFYSDTPSVLDRLIPALSCTDDADLAASQNADWNQPRINDHARGGNPSCPTSSIVAGLASTSFAGSPPDPAPAAGPLRCGSWGRRIPG